MQMNLILVFQNAVCGQIVNMSIKSFVKAVKIFVVVVSTQNLLLRLCLSFLEKPHLKIFKSRLQLLKPFEFFSE